MIYTKNNNSGENKSTKAILKKFNGRLLKRIITINFIINEQKGIMFTKQYARENILWNENKSRQDRMF